MSKWKSGLQRTDVGCLRYWATSCLCAVSMCTSQSSVWALMKCTTCSWDMSHDDHTGAIHCSRNKSCACIVKWKGQCILCRTFMIEWKPSAQCTAVSLIILLGNIVCPQFVVRLKQLQDSVHLQSIQRINQCNALASLLKVYIVSVLTCALIVYIVKRTNSAPVSEVIVYIESAPNCSLILYTICKLTSELILYTKLVVCPKSADVCAHTVYCERTYSTRFTCSILHAKAVSKRCALCTISTNRRCKVSCWSTWCKRCVYRRCTKYASSALFCENIL